jgi:hypothetical protein
MVHNYGGAGFEGKMSTVAFPMKKLGLYFAGDVSGTGQ